MLRVRKAGHVLLAFTVIAALLVVGPASALAATDFVDVPSGHTFEGDIQWLADQGITYGCNPPDYTKFCPDNPVTRGQMAAFLVRALDLTASGSYEFADDDNSIFEADIEKLAEAGITYGCNPPDYTNFCPDNPVTRGQMAAFLVRALDLTDSGGGNTFSDDNGSVFEADIAKLAAAGITYGCNPPANSQFCPDDAVTRGQMAAFLRRAIANRPVVTTSSLPSATVGVSYSRSLAAIGGTQPYVWTITSGDVPSGMLLNLDGTLSGIPSFPGTANFTVNVVDANGKEANADLSLTVVSPLSVATKSLPAAAVGTAYSQSLSANGGLAPYTWTKVSGSLPTGLSLSSSGAITGTPSATGDSDFTVNVTDADGRTASAMLTIITVGSDVAVTTVSLPAGTTGSAYSATLTAGGGSTPYTWAVTVGTLPTGLSLNASSGAITGTPTAAGTSNFTVEVTDDTTNTATRALSITVTGSLAITTSTLPDGTTGVPYSAALAASGGTSPYTWSVVEEVETPVDDPHTGLPVGLGLDSSTGAISGTPDLAGDFSFTVMVTDDAARTATKTLAIHVAFNCDGVLGIQTSECEALVALYDATDGPNWDNNLGWLQEANPCGGAWYGVTHCNQAPAEQHVTYLDLQQNGLSGTIPADLADLVGLQYLNLSGNTLTGSIPSQLGTISTLRGLFLNNNSLSGSIPSALGSLSVLENLEAEDNSLTGTLPSQLGSLTQLRRLRLARNQLTGTIPASFSSLTLLTSLKLNGNAMSGVIDDGITSLINLEPDPETRLCGNGGFTGSASVDSFLSALDANWDGACS
jgi:hypothetical protein